MSFELKGTIIHKGEVMTFKNDFKKIEIVVETKGKYPQKVKLEVLKDNAVKVDSQLKVGSILDLKFDVKGNEYNGKYYNNLVMYKWEDITEDLAVDIPQQTITEEETIESGEELPF